VLDDPPDERQAEAHAAISALGVIARAEEWFEDLLAEIHRDTRSSVLDHQGCGPGAGS
jgi:hypothetical protein